MAGELEIDFPDPRLAPSNLDLLAVSAVDLAGNEVFSTDPDSPVALTKFGISYAPAVLLAAYERGLFPMPLPIGKFETGIGWWSPATRAIFYPDQIRVTRSLEKSLKKFKVTVDHAFEKVVVHCGNPEREQGWIDSDVIAGFTNLHRLGHAHSVEVWNSRDQLVGGLYGVEIGGVFAGESMFHLERDASKVALVHLAEILTDDQQRIIDTQWMTSHLASLGAVELSRADYCDLVVALLTTPSAFNRQFA
ncbi:MAG: leucyl/phenylalanyl-tRNA--protein transferase [Actinobacteria bacterium]|nr:leucyl/phenylalanyl-tRNA--protein transferase [Actinomycetota bacterium]NBY15445.1 leucyl/phenylalanyl-tRNA--protein transferase [Actinomycetota bacterium]